MRFRILLFITVISFVSVKSQEQISSILDSLAQSNSHAEKARLNMVIAKELANDNWERALYYMGEASKSAEKSNSAKTIADFHIAEAEIYSSKGTWDIALQNLVRAYDFYKSQPLKYRYRLENDLAIAYAETENYGKALEFFHKMYDYEHTQKNPLNLASISNNIGLVWMHKDLDSSMFYFNKSLSLIKNIENPDLKMFLFTNLGKSSTLKNNTEAAKHYFHKAINQLNTKNPNENLAWVYGEFSELFLKTEILDSAIYYSKNSVNILDSLAPYGVEQLQALKVLYKSYIKHGDFKNATLNFEKFLSISDSLNLEERKLNVQKILLAEEYRNKEKIRHLEERESKTNFLMLIIGLLAILLILATFLYHYRNKLKRAQLEKQLVTAKQKELKSDLELKNKKLIGKAMVEVHRTEIIEDILKDLKAIKLKTDKKETQKAIDYIANRLKRDTPTDVWKEFEVRFEQVHESFYKNLEQAHPELSAKDKRLCALLKLNLTSKEIAQIIGQPPKSVENARTRLRKKLKITNSQTELNSYLSKFG